MATPASVAELSSQQALPDMSSTEANPQVKKEEENTVGKKQVDIKMEVLYFCIFFKIIFKYKGKHVLSACLCIIDSSIWTQDSWVTVFLLL